VEIKFDMDKDGLIFHVDVRAPPTADRDAFMKLGELMAVSVGGDRRRREPIECETESRRRQLPRTAARRRLAKELGRKGKAVLIRKRDQEAASCCL
jgi:hypothetical protein